MRVALPAQLRVASLFSGGGGLDLGVHLATRGRARTVVYVEREAFAAACLVARMEEAELAPAPVWDDVASFDGRPWRGVVDCLAFGSPCQDLSVAGKRAGLAGARSGLFFEGLRIADECCAPLVFWENVGGAAGALPAVFAAFEEAGYRGAAVSLRAADVGAPHQRKRFFVLAYRGGVGLGLALLRAALDEHRRHAPGHFADGRDAGVGDASGLADELLREPRELRGAERAAGGAGHAPARGEPRAAGPDVVQRDRGVRGEARPPDGRRAVEHPESERRRQGRAEPDAEGQASSVGASSQLADSARERGEGHGARGLEEPHAPARAGLPRRGCGVFPPGPGDVAGWERWLAAGGPAPAEPRLRRGADGVASGLVPAGAPLGEWWEPELASWWVDRLRLLGNGVVPLQAAEAFRFLAGHLIHEG